MIGHVRIRRRSPGRSRLTPPHALLLGLIVVLTVFPNFPALQFLNHTTMFLLAASIFLFFLFLYRQLVTGLTAGAVE